MDNFLIIFVTLGQLLIPSSSYNSMIFRMNYNVTIMSSKSPHIVLVSLFDVDNDRVYETRNGFIVNEKTILTWGSMTPELTMVSHVKFRRSIPSFITPWDDEEKTSQVIGVKGVKNHPCLPQLALIELEKPLVFNQYFQPIWFHADYQNEIEQNVEESWIEGWSWVKLVQEFFIDFQKTEVESILKCSTEEMNQTYFTACSKPQDEIVEFSSGKNKNEPCLYPGAGLLVREKGQNQSYLAGIAYPDEIYTLGDSYNSKCPINLKFLDLTKMLCWISGSAEFSPNCSNPGGFEDNCEISDINKNWSLEAYLETAEDLKKAQEIKYLRKFIFLWLIFIFILICTLIYIIFRTRICK